MLLAVVWNMDQNQYRPVSTSAFRGGGFPLAKRVDMAGKDAKTIENTPRANYRG